MKMDETKIEQALRETPRPEPSACLLQKLYADLPNEPAPAAKPVFFGHHVAWIGAMMLMLAVTAWGAQQIFKVYISENRKTEVFESPHTVTAPGGGKLTARKFVTNSIEVKADGFNLNKSDEPGLIKQARAQIRAGNADLIKVEDSADGEVYVYKVKLPDGKETEYRSRENILNVPEPKPETILADVTRNDDGTLSASQWKRQNGTFTRTSLSEGTKWDEDPLHEIPTLIEQGERGDSLKIHRTPDKHTLFIYRLTLSNGTKVDYGVMDKPLPSQKPDHD